MKRMAHGWDTYFQNFPSGASDSGTLTRTSDSDNLETCIQHHDFVDPVTSHESPASSTNYFLNPSTENSGTDCVYQKYYGEMPWQAHGEQVEKHYLSSNGNGDILDFPTSFTSDFQELKQDCELLNAPFLEDYSDVSSCSDADVGETRSSWKFLGSNSATKYKADLGTKHQSSEWHFDHPGKPFPIEGLSPKMSDTCTNANIPKPPNMKAEENTVSCPQDHLEGPEKYESCTKSNPFSDSTSIVTATASETQEEPREDLRSCIDNITFEKIMECSGSVQDKVIPTPVSTCSETNFLLTQSFDEHNAPPKKVKDNCDENMPSEYQESKIEAEISLNLDSQGTKESKVAGGCDLNSEHLNEYKFNESGPQNILNSSTLSEGKEKNISGQKDQSQAGNAETILEKHNSSENEPEPSEKKCKSAEKLPTTLTPSKEERDENVLCDIPPVGTFNQDLQRLTDPPECLQVKERTYTTNPTDRQSDDLAVKRKQIGQDSCLDTSDILKDPKIISKKTFSFTSPSELCQNECPMALHPNCVSKSDISEIACIPSFPEQCLSSGKDLDALPPPNHGVKPSEKTTPFSQDEELSLPKKRIYGDDIDGNGNATSSQNQKQLGYEFQKDLQSQSLSEECENASAPISSVKQQSRNQFSVELKPDDDENTLFPLDLPQPLDQSCLCPQTQSLLNEDENKSPNASISYDYQSQHQSPLAIQHQSFDGETGEKTNASAYQDQQGHSNDIQLEGGLEENYEKINNPCLLDQQNSSKHPLTQSGSKNNEENVKLLSSVAQPKSLDQLLQQPEANAGNSALEYDSMEKQHVLHHDQAHPLKSCAKMRKRWQPVVICNPLKSANARPNQYRCGVCQYTTHDADNLIEHRNNVHVPHSFQFCEVCSLYLVSQNEAENEVCCVTNKGPRLSSNTSFGPKKTPRRTCKDCNISFSRFTHYVRHMRTHTGKTPYQCNGCGCYYAQSSALRRHQTIPNRCKRVKEKSAMSDAISSNPETQLQRDFAQDDTNSHLPKCYVKLVDIFKTKMCTLSGITFSTATKPNKRSYIMHKKNVLGFDLKNDTASLSHETKKKVKNETAVHKCPFCPRTFKYSFNRNRHLRDCVRNLVLGGKRKVGKRYCCPLCSTTFASPSTRAKHIKISCLRKYINSLRFKEKITLTPDVHQKKNKEAESEPNLEAEQKPKETLQKSQLREDKQNKQATPTSTVHQTLKLYRCNECPAVFRYASGKYRHKKKHELFKLTGKKFSYRNSTIVKESEPESISSKDPECKDDLEPSQDRDLSLRCYFCGKHCSSSQQLKNHERIHNGEGRYKCLECGKKFKTSYHLRSHRMMHKRSVQCTICKKMLPTIGELIQHRRTHTKKGMLQCPDCPLQFQFPVYLLRHLEVHIRIERELQKEKAQINPEPSSVAQKEQRVSKVFRCSLCKKRFSSARVLRNHSLSHISKSNQCPFCNRKFSSRRYLLRHTMRHMGEKPYSCTYCGKQFYRHLYLTSHSSMCVPTQTNTVLPQYKKRGAYKCSHCPRTFKDRERLTNHHRNHDKNSLIPCSTCGQYFSTRKLRQHLAQCNQTSSPADCSAQKKPSKSSTTKKPLLKCLHCSKRFKYKSLLLRHLVTHKGDQSFACVHCGHKYKSRAMCSEHEALCEGVSNAKLTNFSDGSDGSSNVLSNLTLEDATQNQADSTSEFKCKFCTKTFTKSRSLRHHILSHNEVKPYRCKSCNSCFSRYDYLKVHQTHCNGKRRRLEVCIPKISLDDVGTGWQNKLGIEPSRKQKGINCDGCGKLFVNKMCLKKHKKRDKCRMISIETKTPLGIEPPTQKKARVCYTKNKMNQLIKPCFNKKNKYACSYCPRTFRHSWTQAIHKRLHTGERPFACHQCGERFIRKDYVKRHLVKCPKREQPKKVLCEKCGGFFSTAVIQGHKSKCTVKPSASHPSNCQSQQSVSQSPPKGFSCAYCSSRFLLFSQLQEHFLNAHKLETVLPTMPVASLQHHLSNIHDMKEEPVEEICDKLPHDNKCVNSKPDTALKTQHVCPECNMTFINKAGLVGHMRAHSTDPPFRCKTCKIGFWNKNFLRNHYRKCNLGLNKVPLKAQIDLALDDSVLVFKDSSKATGSGVLQTSFSCKDDLTEPSMHGPETQKAESKYQCSECDKSFTDGLLLISHLEDHGREELQKKLNKCSQCGRVCTSQSNLERHMRTHAVNQKFPCPVCSNVFYTLSDLESHSSLHDKNRPYCCRLCKQRFWKRPPLYDHYKKDHPSEAFACHLCDSAYIIKKSLQRHYKESHPKEQQIFSSRLGTADESDEESNSEGSDSDTAPYFPCHVCGKTFHTSESLEDHQRCHLGEKPHECEECGKCFYQASQLQQHRRMHKSEFQCQICGRGFMSLFALRKHKHTQSKNRPHRCSKCDISFPGPWQLAEHMKTHCDENFPCDVCGQVFLSKRSRAEHRKSHLVSDPPSVSMPGGEKYSLAESSPEFIKEFKYRCGVCNERFKDPEHLSEHGCKAANERPYVCSDCDKHFLHSSHLKKHRNTHHPSWANTDYPCNLCKSSFSSSQNYLSHIKTHTASPAQSKHNADNESKKSSNFKCPVCHQQFYSSIHLISHFPTHLDIIFECKMCKMTFPSRQKLEEHKQCHLTPTTEFECTECRQKFLGREAFQKHRCSRQKHVNIKSGHMEVSPEKSSSTAHQAMRMEDEEDVDVTGDDLYHCPCCSLQFSSKSNLLEHQNKDHQANKSYRCETCGKLFALRQYLRKHERRHHGMRPTKTLPVKSFTCSHCHIKFTAIQDFSLHMRLHTEKQSGQYRCDMCYRSFEQLTSLKRHQESHVGEVVYECTECDKAFAFPHLLEEHQQTHASSSQ